MSPGRNLLWNTRVIDEKGGTVFIRERDAVSYITEEFFMALEVFYTTENLGCLPFFGGWAEQPVWITQALSVLKVERFRADEEEREAKLAEAEDARKYGRQRQNT